MVADCHCTASSSSATEMLHPWRNWSLSERTTCRRSLSDCACSMRTSRVNRATAMVLPCFQAKCKSCCDRLEYYSWHSLTDFIRLASLLLSSSFSEPAINDKSPRNDLAYMCHPLFSPLQLRS